MRPLPLLLAAALTLAGCLGSEETDPDETNSSMGPSEGGDGTGLPAPVGVPASDLQVGTSFTFSTRGLWEGEERVTVVVAEASDEGYLLAGASPEDLPTDIAWNQPFFGQVDRSLRETRGDRTNALFEFPLHDGKTWAWGDGEVVVTERDVPTPAGSEPGFELVYTVRNWTTTYTYAPSLGFLTSMRAGNADHVFHDAVLESVGTSNTWTWYEELGRFWPERPADGAPFGTTTFELPEGADALVASVGATEGNRVVLAPPGRQPWTFEATSPPESWAVVIFPAAPGPWTASTLDPEGWAWAEMVAVRWTGS